MEPSEIVKEARALIAEGQDDRAMAILERTQENLQTSPPENLGALELQKLQGDVNGAIGEIYLKKQDPKQALSRLLLAMQAYQSQEVPPEKDLFPVYMRLSACFQQLGQQFEGEKYARLGAEIQSKLIKGELIQNFMSAGWKTKEDIEFATGAKFDLVGEKGGFRKKKVSILFALDEAEVDTVGYLLKDVPGTKIIYLLSGEPGACFPPKGVTVINRISDVPM